MRGDSVVLDEYPKMSVKKIGKDYFIFFKVPKEVVAEINRCEDCDFEPKINEKKMLIGAKKLASAVGLGWYDLIMSLEEADEVGCKHRCLEDENVDD